MKRPILILLALGILAAPSTAVAAPLDLQLLGRTPALGAERAEISAYAPGANRLFVTNDADDRIDVYHLDSGGLPVSDGPLAIPGGGSPTSVDVSRQGLVAVALLATPNTDPGRVAYFDAATLSYLGSDTVGAGPDMVTFTYTGRYLLVANEGEPTATADPDGSVSVIRFDSLAPGLPTRTVRTASFTGVPTAGSPRTFGGTNARDFEPEYITRALGDRRAYVSLQEANAVAILDIPQAKFTLVRGLGYKDYGLAGNSLDPNDQNGTGLGAYANVFGMYQPDAVAAYRLGGHTYVATANEGDARVVGGEDVRASTLGFDASVFPAPLPTTLGRLNVSKLMGNTDADPQLEQLYSFGARSMSILNSSGQIVFDTGNQLEKYIADNDAANHNKSNTAGSVSDNRSDDKGPEPEGIAVGPVRGRTYAFVAAERSGGLFAYDLQAPAAGQATLVDYINTREADLGPEGVRFVRATQSPTGKPLVLVSHEVSGTVAVFQVNGGGQAP